MKRFAGRVVLLTGAARGIGSASSEIFAREGARVVVTDYDLEDACTSVALLAKEGLLIEGDKLDVAREDEWDRVVDGIIARYGRLDVLVNNAGVARIGDAENGTLDDWRETMKVNLEAVFLGTRKAISVMKELGGSIVNVASIAGNVGEPLLAAYNASKGGVRLFTKAAALDCANKGYPIRINSIHPGYTETKLVKDAIGGMPAKEGNAYTQHIIGMIPVRRLARPMEIARPLVFLASDDASYMTGSELVVDGGYTAA
jgi:NAD(P)-dependent dehydrogenase (short-subunit alcohol dehydrogenase family)